MGGSSASISASTAFRWAHAKWATHQSARRFFEADLQERPSATLSERREFLEKAANVRVSDSTVSRMLRRLGWSRQKDRWERESPTSS